MGMDGRSTGERQSGEREETRGEWVDGFLVVRASSSFVSLEKRSPNERTIHSFIHSLTHSFARGWVVVLSDRGDEGARDDDGGDADARDRWGANERERASSSIVDVDRARQGG